MAKVIDVAEYILRRKGPMTAMKLQKLVYYCQAWSLVWDEKPLFEARIEAWANGPVVPYLYKKHRKEFKLNAGFFSAAVPVLTDIEESTIIAVLKAYGDKASQWLSDLTHAELPWKEARHGMTPDQRGSEEITQAAMAEYYGSLIRK